ncbi:unnamed protein product [Miscanthus lutarioriparius]|uniref:Uncharacterized protein n=1 Tax=Miscanthus lutarioriparius TaxID=422564 RepID=A0A811QNP8_9POAL|nr:unnamed protein product [Miscanthus lutarioriparius]
MKMRTPAIAFAALLMLLLLATRAHGIRLDRQLHEAIDSKKMADPKTGDAEASVAGDPVKKHCTPDGRCSGKVKKALAHAEAAAEAKQQSNSTGNDHHTAVDIKAATQQGRRHEAAEATSSSASSSPAPPGVAARQTYPDIMDIAGMDYSPATRKPPIHN